MSALRFWVPVVLLAFATTIAQHFYSVRSEAITAGSFSELPFISSTHLISSLSRRRGTWADTVFSDTIDHTAPPILAYYVNPSQIIFLSADWYDKGGNPRRDCEVDPCVFIASNEMFDAFTKLRKTRAKYFHHASFDFSLRGKKLAVDHFWYDVRGTDAHLTANTQFIEQIRESVFNHWAHAPRAGENIYRVTSSPAVKNHLVFVAGSVSSVYGLGIKKTGLFGIERDPYYKKKVIAPLGHYLLFRTIVPSHHVRMVLSITASFAGARNDQLPPAAVVGKRREPFHLIGHGSARVFSDVIVPRSMDDMRFVGLDLGRKAIHIPQPPRTGIMNLYGRNVVLDPRLITVWARDISLIPNGRYVHMRPPATVARFPADLANPALQYSGVYEDGWISDRAYFVLQPTLPGSKLVVRALIPLGAKLSYWTRICVRLDAAKPVCHAQGPGAFSFEQAVPSATRHTVEIDVAHPQRLSAADPRLLGAKLDFVGFTR